ncbi:MAG: outer membrane protein assembly factor BamB [Endozoicomonadaceae bacterium]|nr:outer membrane protein assembly factor BamB [Endozoicomonadaceae bacterium]
MKYISAVILRMICVIFMSVFVLTGCVNHLSVSHRSVKKLPNFDKKITLDMLWKQKVGKHPGRKSIAIQPVATDNEVYAAHYDGSVVAYDRHNGKILWQVVLHDNISGGLCVHLDVLTVATMNGNIIALDRKNQGKLLWRCFVGGQVLSAPIIQNNKMFLQSINGKIIALNATTGKQIWQENTVFAPLMLRGSSKPLYKNNVLFTGLSTGELIGWDAETGEKVWTTFISRSKDSSELLRMSDIISSPVFINSNLYVINFNGNLSSFDTENGIKKWSISASSYTQLETNQKVLYYSSSLGGLYAINSESGAINWKQLVEYPRHHLSHPLVINDWVFVGDNYGYIHILSKKTGHIVGRQRVNTSIRTKPLVQDNIIYILTDKDELIAFKIREL